MHYSFLQSAEWEEIQKNLGRRTHRIGGILLVEHALPLGLRYLYVPRPVIEHGSDFFSHAGEIAKSEGQIFLRVDPAGELSLPSGISPVPVFSLQPRESTICDLKKNTDQLFSDMREKMRYNIRLAGRKGITVRQGEARELNLFWNLLVGTASRDGFYTHPKTHYEALLRPSSSVFQNQLFFAEHQGVPVASALVNFYRNPKGGHDATYLHGASSFIQRNLMAPHFLHWHIMQEAKRRGCMRYDLWGIDEKKWPGVTRFKNGFGGIREEYPQSFDIIYRKIYYHAYRLMRGYRVS